MRARVLLGTCLTLGITVVSSGCASDGSSCAAVVSYAEPVLTIRHVTGPGGVPVGTVEVTRLRRDGRPALTDVANGLRFGREWIPGLVTNDADLHSNLQVSGGRLLCEVPCAFGSFAAADAELRVAASGAHGTWRGPVGYGTSRGCGPTLDDGVDLELVLSEPRQ